MISQVLNIPAPIPIKSLSKYAFASQPSSPSLHRTAASSPQMYCDQRPLSLHRTLASDPPPSSPLATTSSRPAPTCPSPPPPPPIPSSSHMAFESQGRKEGHAAPPLHGDLNERSRDRPLHGHGEFSGDDWIKELENKGLKTSGHGLYKPY